MTPAPPSIYQLFILAGLSKKPAGEVYAGTARDRPSRRRLPAAKARARLARATQTHARSSFARRPA